MMRRINVSVRQQQESMTKLKYNKKYIGSRLDEDQNKRHTVSLLKLWIVYERSALHSSILRHRKVDT